MGQRAQSWNERSSRQKVKELRDSVFAPASTQGGYANCSIQSLVNLFSCDPRNESTIPTRSCPENDGKSHVDLRKSTDGIKENTSLNGRHMQENYSALPKMQYSIKFTPTIELPSTPPLGVIPLRVSDSVKLHRQSIHLTLSGETRTNKEHHVEEKEVCSVTEKMEEPNDSRLLDGFDRPEDTSQMTLETTTSSRPASVPFSNTSELESISDSRERTPTPKLRTRKMKSRSLSESMRELCRQDLGPSYRPKTVSATLCVGLQMSQKTSRESAEPLKVLKVKKDASRSPDLVSSTGQSFPRPPETHQSTKPSRKHLDGFNKVTLETGSTVPMPFRTSSHNQELISSRIMDTSKSNFVLTADASKSMGADEVRITPKPPTPIRPPCPRIMTIRKEGHDPKRECSLDAHLRRLGSEDRDFLPLEPLMLNRRENPLTVHDDFRSQTENCHSAQRTYTYPGPKYKCCTALVLDVPKVIRQRSTRRLATWNAVTQQGDTMVHGQIPIPDDLSTPPALVWTQKVARKSGQVSFDLSNNLCYQYERSDIPTAQGERIVGYVSSTGDAPGEGISQTPKGRKCLRVRREREAVWHVENPYYDGVSTADRKPKHSVPHHEQNRPTLLIGYSSNLYPSRFASQMPVVNESPARIFRFEPRSQLSRQENSSLVFQSEKPGWKKREYHYSSSPTLPTLPTPDISSSRPFGFSHDLKFYKGATFERLKSQNRRPIFQIIRAGSDQPTT
ncbi:hypothetical protein CRM22_001739 [Opisthorchis felineus]|uniref:Uncharacterized protein n=1 Tax=Opisthorchis felineus TaxID=147828 RepID=A0A4S2MFL2_OPIFE|nr:hypothetical protein CRM22_001739 [Opisthorchis felineus]